MGLSTAPKECKIVELQGTYFVFVIGLVQAWLCYRNGVQVESITITRVYAQDLVVAKIVYI